MPNNYTWAGISQWLNNPNSSFWRMTAAQMPPWLREYYPNASDAELRNFFAEYLRNEGPNLDPGHLATVFQSSGADPSEYQDPEAPPPPPPPPPDRPAYLPRQGFAGRVGQQRGTRHIGPNTMSPTGFDWGAEARTGPARAGGRGSSGPLPPVPGGGPTPGAGTGVPTGTSQPPTAGGPPSVSLNPPAYQPPPGSDPPQYNPPPAQSQDAANIASNFFNEVQRRKGMNRSY